MPNNNQHRPLLAISTILSSAGLIRLATANNNAERFEGLSAISTGLYFASQAIINNRYPREDNDITPNDIPLDPNRPTQLIIGDSTNINY